MSSEVVMRETGCERVSRTNSISNCDWESIVCNPFVLGYEQTST